MAVYIDRMKSSYRGMIMSHMLADSLEELACGGRNPYGRP
jgi:hypothetical protein